MKYKLFVALTFACAWIGMSSRSIIAQGSQYYFPQVADGVYPGGFYSTSITVSNVFAIDNTVSIRFTRSSGSAWAIDLRSADRPEIAGRKSSVTFTLRARESVLIYTGGMDPLAVGWARLESEFPLVTSEFFGVLKGAPASYLNAEAGVLPSPLATKLSFFADYSRDEPVSGTHVDTGFAVINPSGASAQITATLFSRTGTNLGQGLITLAPGAHTAQFISELFRSLSLPASFHGQVRFSSNVNIAVVALRQTFGNSDTISTVSVVPDSATGSTIMYDREPNDGPETAQPIEVFPAEIIGTMNSSNDTADLDIFSVNLRAGDTLYVFALADFVYSPLDSSIRIWDSQHRQVAEVDNFSDGLADPFVRYRIPTAGVYYIDFGSVNRTSSRDSYYRLYVMYK